MENKNKDIAIVLVMGLAICFMCGCVTCPSAKGRAGLQTYGRRFIKEHPDLSAEHKNAILSGELTIGMSRDMATASLGQPDATHAYEYQGKAMETWTYTKNLLIFGKEAYVKFEDGRVIGWDMR